MKIIGQIFFVLLLIALGVFGAVYYFEISFAWSDLSGVIISLCFLALSWFTWIFTYKFSRDYFRDNNHAIFINLIVFAFFEAVVSVFICDFLKVGFKGFLVIFTILFGLTVSGLYNSQKNH